MRKMFSEKQIKDLIQIAIKEKEQNVPYYVIFGYFTNNNNQTFDIGGRIVPKPSPSDQDKSIWIDYGEDVIEIQLVEGRSYIAVNDEEQVIDSCAITVQELLTNKVIYNLET